MIPVQRQNTRLWHFANAMLRFAVLRGATRPFSRNVIVNEYPKSGGTWFSQMLAAALDLPYPRNRLPMLRSCLMQCHVLSPIGMRNVVVVWRDGRDVMVSYYHHLLNGHDYADPEFPLHYRRSLGITDVEDVRSNLPRFIEALFERRLGPRFTWAEFVDTWHGRPNVLEVRYEDLLIDPVPELIRVASSLGGLLLSPERAAAITSDYSFEKQAGRTQGTAATGKFLRKGIAGDWVNVFSQEAIEIFDHHAGGALDRLGYTRKPT